MTNLTRLAITLGLFLYGLVSAGCAITPKSYIGNYEVVCGKDKALAEARSMTKLLAHTLSREIDYVTDEDAGLQAILKDNRKVRPQSAVPIVVTYIYQSDSYSVTLRKQEPGEDEQVLFLKKQIEEILKRKGARWSFRGTSWSFAG